MKKTITWMLAVLLLISSCAKTEPQDASETADPTVPPLTDELPEPEETDPPADETVPVPDIAEPEEEPDEEPADPPAPETPSAGDMTVTDDVTVPDPEKLEKTDEKTPAEPSVIVMNVPREYVQVYEKIKNSQASGGYYYDGWIVEEEVMEEVAVEEAPMKSESVSNSISMDAVFDVPAMESAPAPAPEPGKVYREDEYSKTNTQVADIDEGDIVKTDGEYIYVLKDNRELLILSAAGEDTEVLSRRTVAENSDDKGDDFYYSYSQNASELYVYEDTLAVVLTAYEWSETWEDGRYSYTNDNRSYIEFYDVSDPTEPVRKACSGQDGYYSASRMMDGVIYLITNYNVPYNCLREDYEQYIPGLHHNGVQELMPADCIVYPEELRSRTYSVVCSYSMKNRERTHEKSVLGYSGTIYMSGDHLYLADSYYFEDVLDEYTERIYKVEEVLSGYRTEIIKLDLTGEDGITVAAAGTVDGELLNQFSMDEYDGHLRVVTTYWQNSRKIYRDEELGFTNYKYSDSGQTNGLYVLDSDMNLVGEVSGLAEDERVYSVRFSGDVGYFVTFRQVDPLFAVDLSDPAEPKIMSALKIPGFSNYLHPYSDTLLFGLGQDADEETGWTTGMKLSMFDVSDPYDVVEKDKLLLDIGYSTALYNHKAILISASRGIIGFPCDSGYVVYGYSEDEGFREITRTELDGVYWNGNSRGLYVGDYMYIVLQNCTAVLDMENFELIATIEY